jgi:hypothetical protein
MKFPKLNESIVVCSKARAVAATPTEIQCQSGSTWKHDANDQIPPASS